MAMTERQREWYLAEVARIRKELNVPDDVDVVILDADAQSAAWIQEWSSLPDEQARVARAIERASMNREEGGDEQEGTPDEPARTPEEET